MICPQCGWTGDIGSEAHRTFIHPAADPVTEAGLDVERLARAIWARHYEELDESEIPEWKRDLDAAFETYASPSRLAEEIAAEYARQAAKETG